MDVETTCILSSGSLASYMGPSEAVCINNLLLPLSPPSSQQRPPFPLKMMRDQKYVPGVFESLEVMSKLPSVETTGRISVGGRRKKLRLERWCGKGTSLLQHQHRLCAEKATSKRELGSTKPHHTRAKPSPTTTTTSSSTCYTTAFKHAVHQTTPLHSDPQIAPPLEPINLPTTDLMIPSEIDPLGASAAKWSFKTSPAEGGSAGKDGKGLFVGQKRALVAQPVEVDADAEEAAMLALLFPERAEATPPPQPTKTREPRTVAIPPTSKIIESEQMWYDNVENHSTDTTLIRKILADVISGNSPRRSGKTPQQPPLVTHIEGVLCEQIASLNAKLAHMKTTKHNKSEADLLNTYLQDRLSVYRECGGVLCRHLKGYGRIFLRVLNEYETYLKYCKRQKRSAAARQKAAEQEKDVLEDSLQRNNEYLGGVDERIRSETDKMYSILAEGKQFFDMYLELSEAKEALSASREETRQLQRKLAASKHLKVQFDATVLSIEETFRVISTEKDLQIANMTQSMAGVRTECEGQKRDLQRQLAKVEDVNDDLNSEKSVVAAQTEILRNLLRQAEGRASLLEEEKLALHEELQEMEARLQELEQHASGSDMDDSEGTTALIERACVIVPALNARPEEVTSLTDLVERLLEVFSKMAS